MVGGAPRGVSGPLRVLVVDDSPEIRLVREGALRDEGHDVVSAADGLEGLNAAAARDPDVILLDLVMPVANAWQFCEAYRALPSSRAAIVVMSAVRDPERAAADLGAERVLRKPFDIDGVLEAIAQAAQAAGAAAGRARAAGSPMAPAEGRAGAAEDSPRVAGGKSGPAAEIAGPGSGPRGRVLVVDDDEAVRVLLASALAEEGYAVLQASDGDEALALLGGPGRTDAAAVDVILLDLMMPGTSGWTFLERYRGWAGPRAAVVVVTALDPTRVRLPSRASVSAVVRKPFPVDRVLSLVAEHAPRAGRRRGGPAGKVA